MNDSDGLTKCGGQESKSSRSIGKTLAKSRIDKSELLCCRVSAVSSLEAVWLRFHG